MNEGQKAQKILNELAELIVQSKPTLRSDYIVGFYRLWTRLPAIERALIKKGILTQSDIDIEQIPLLEESKEDFKLTKNQS
ncbi:MAG TPA: hypothetical protein VJC39_04890 [Candidatus Nanoarchaeia archaeon]|nr:hypothetical protein [Candidatus Nanoarchaeia archaeon]